MSYHNVNAFLHYFVKDKCKKPNDNNKHVSK